MGGTLSVFLSMVEEFEKMFKEDVSTNKAMGNYGADDILDRCNKKPVRVLTHCNTGSLATAGYGTALGTSMVLLFWFKICCTVHMNETIMYITFLPILTNKCLQRFISCGLSIN